MTATHLDDSRLRRLIGVGWELMEEQDLDALLDRLLEAARELTGARYAAIGVLDPSRRELERFVAAGLDEEARRRIGELPRGRGVLGVLIDDPRPLRLDDVGRHPRSYGFPSGHPPMHSFLGVPILIGGDPWGNLYLTDKQGGSFDAGDEELSVILASWAAIAIGNARLYQATAARRDELERVVRRLEAMTAIARAVGDETDLERILELIVKRGRALVEARSLVIWLLEGDELVMAAAAGDVSPRARGTRMPIAGTVSGEVLRSGRPERLADISARMRISLDKLGIEARTGLLVPVTFRDRRLGLLIALDHLGADDRFHEDHLRLLVSFASSAATAVATAQSVAEERLRHSIRASERERRRWARELHDETLQALASLRVLLGSARRQHDRERLEQAVDDAVAEIGDEIRTLRALITELRAAALDDIGLEAGIESLTQRAGTLHGLSVEATVDLGQDPRLDSELESTVYRLVQESLTNAGKHAHAVRVAVRVRRAHDVLLVEVSDDGDGFDATSPTTGFGLVGMRERIALAGGELSIDSAPGEGTTVRARLPAGPAAEPLPRAS